MRHQPRRELTTLDRTSEVAVDAYNAKVEQRDKLIESYQTASPPTTQGRHR
jgi:hypothetical protein